MYTVLVISVIIVIVVLILAVVTTSKAYTYKHTVDSLEDNPLYTDHEQSETKSSNQDQNQ